MKKIENYRQFFNYMLVYIIIITMIGFLSALSGEPEPILFITLVNIAMLITMLNDYYNG